jgi:hypothetical protein
MRYSQSSFYEATSSKDEHCQNCGYMPLDHQNGACVDNDPDIEKESEDMEEWDLDATPEDADWIKHIKE